MRTFILRLKKRFLEWRHLGGPFDRAVSLKLDAIQSKLDSLPASGGTDEKPEPCPFMVPVRVSFSQGTT